MSGSTVFVPRTLEPVQIDKMTVKLYPVVDSTMKPPERAHAFYEAIGFERHGYSFRVTP